jgi:hypothetical protein
MTYGLPNSRVAGCGTRGKRFNRRGYLSKAQPPPGVQVLGDIGFFFRRRMGAKLSNLHPFSNSIDSTIEFR